MDLLGEANVAKSQEEAEEGGARKQRATVPKAERDNMERIEQQLDYVTKLALWTSQQTKQLLAVIIWSCKLNHDVQWVVAIKAAMEKFEAQARKMRKELSNDEVKERLLSPHAHAFNSVVVVYLELMEEKNKEMATKIKDSLNVCKDMPQGALKYMDGSIPHFRISRMYNSNHKCLEIAGPTSQNITKESVDASKVLTPAQMWWLIREGIEKDRTYKELRGVAPRGDQERKLQEMLERQHGKERDRS